MRKFKVGDKVKLRHDLLQACMNTPLRNCGNLSSKFTYGLGSEMLQDIKDAKGLFKVTDIRQYIAIRARAQILGGSSPFDWGFKDTELVLVNKSDLAINELGNFPKKRKGEVSL